MAVGRPTKRSPETEALLAQAFSLGATVDAACYHAGIGRSTFFDWAREDVAFSDRMAALKQKPVLQALQTVVGALEDPAMARWYLERRHEDFKPKQAVEQSGSVDVRLSDASERVLDRLLTRANDA